MLFYEHVIKADRENRNYCLATVVATEGNTPRKAGSKLLVFDTGETFGSVGGGAVEKSVTEDCLALLKTGGTLLKTYSHFEENDPAMACANNVTVFMECSAHVPHLYLCGGGHVAQAILKIAKSVGYHVTLLDTRDLTAFGDAVEGADEIVRLERFSDIEKQTFSPGAAVVVCTFSHKGDEEAVLAAAGKQPSYLGILGGKPKLTGIFHTLQEKGFSTEQIRSIHAPIGLDTGGEKPAEIAVSVMAEIMTVLNHKSGRPMKELIDIPLE